MSVSASKSAGSSDGDPFSRLCYTEMGVYLPDIVESDSDTVYLLRLCLLCHFSFWPWVSTATISPISRDVTIMLHKESGRHLFNMDPTGFLQDSPYRASDWLPSLVMFLTLESTQDISSVTILSWSCTLHFCRDGPGPPSPGRPKFP